MVVGGQRHVPAALSPRNRRFAHCIGNCTGLRAVLDESGKISLPPGFDPRTTQRVASRYTDYAIPAHT